jgi:hypothetical protein
MNAFPGAQLPDAMKRKNPDAGNNKYGFGSFPYWKMAMISARYKRF